MDKLRQLRIRHNLSQKELAAKLKMSQNSVSSWENGVRSPREETLIKISKIFNVPKEYLLHDEVVSLTDTEKELIEVFRRLDDRGRGAIITALQFHRKYIEDLE